MDRDPEALSRRQASASYILQSAYHTLHAMNLPMFAQEMLGRERQISEGLANASMVDKNIANVLDLFEVR